MTHLCPHCSATIFRPSTAAGGAEGDAYTPRRVVFKVQGSDIRVTCPDCKRESPIPWLTTQEPPPPPPVSRRIVIRARKAVDMI